MSRLLELSVEYAVLYSLISALTSLAVLPSESSALQGPIDSAIRGGAKQKPEDCRQLAMLVPKEDSKPAAISLFAAVREHSSDVATCASLTSVVARLAKRDRTPGRNGRRPLNIRLAQDELQAASRDPVVSAQLARIASETSDENLRLVYEAAILDQHGFQNAKEFKIEQLRRRID